LRGAVNCDEPKADLGFARTIVHPSQTAANPSGID